MASALRECTILSIKNGSSPFLLPGRLFRKKNITWTLLGHIIRGIIPTYNTLKRILTSQTNAHNVTLNQHHHLREDLKPNRRILHDHQQCVPRQKVQPLQTRAAWTPPPWDYPPRAANTRSSIPLLQRNISRTLLPRHQCKTLIMCTMRGPHLTKFLIPLAKTQIFEPTLIALPPPNHHRAHHCTLRTSSR